MKPLFQDINALLFNQLLYIKEIKEVSFKDHIHFHNGYEIALILNGSGKRVVGDNIENYAENDLVFIGPYLPHVTYHEGISEEAHNPDNLSALVVYFHPNWFAKDLLSSSEFIEIRDFLDKMSRGISVWGKTKKKAIQSLIELKECKGFSKTIKFWNVLYLILESNEYKCLASESYSKGSREEDTDRLNNVYQYVRENYSNLIKLEDVSSVANMTPSAFCKYFKAKTKKTFVSFVNEFRVAQACRLLSDLNLSISDICYSCGFNNLTNFNRNFKHFYNKAPSEYRKIINNGPH